MNNTIKKISAIGLSLTTVMCLSGAAMALPIVALGVTTDELQAQITALLAQIQALQTQLTAAQGATTVSYNFTKDLTLGSKGNDVKALQQFLNANGYQVAASGVGSTGNETTYFGSLTKAALAKYQAAKGISPAVGYFGPITRAYVASLAVAPTTPTVPTTPTTPTEPTTPVTPVTPAKSGDQGTMDVKLAASPASGEDLYEAETGQAIYGIETKASDSEIYVSRVKLQFNTAINNIISKVGLYRDGTLLAEKVINSDAVTRITSSNYTTQLTGFESKIDKGVTATFIVKVDALSSVDSGYSSFTVLAPAGALRAVDGANISVGDTSAALSANTVNVKQSGASAALLTISKNANSPDTSYQVSDSTGKAEKVTLLIMNVKAEQDSIKLTDLVANISVTGAGTSSIAYLYDGTTLVDSATVTAGTGVTTFSDFSWTIPKDTTKQLTLQATFTGIATTTTNASSTVTAAATTVAEGSDGIALATGRKTVSATGAEISLFKVVPVFTLTSAVVTKTAAEAGVSSTTAAVNIKFTVKALGGDIIVSSTNNITVIPYLGGVATATALDEAYTITGATYDGTDLYTIAQDGTATFEVAGTLDMVGGLDYAAGNYNFRLTGFKWYPGAITATQITTAFLDDLSTNPFITNTVYLPQLVAINSDSEFPDSV